MKNYLVVIIFSVLISVISTYTIVIQYVTNPQVKDLNSELLTLGAYFQNSQKERDYYKNEYAKLLEKQQQPCEAFHSTREEFLAAALQEGLNIQQIKEVADLYDTVCDK